ncbi:hypothetical protein JCM11641_002050 [Rhodosporidiobolus odoratus]
MTKTILAILKALPGKEEDIAKYLKTIREHSPQESGCKSYKVHRNGAEFVCIEEYIDDAAIQAHHDNPGVKAFLGAVGSGQPLLEGQPQLLGPFEEL